MKNSLKLAAISLAIVVGAASSHAQSTNTNTTGSITINPQNLTISLTGFAGTGGAGAASFKIANKDVLNAMGISPSGAKLQVGTAAASVGTNVNSSLMVVVTTGSSNNKTNIDVTRFFSVEPTGADLTKGNTSYQISLLGFGTDTSGNVLTNGLGVPLSPLTFLVQGYTTTQKSGSFNSNVNGPGTSAPSGVVGLVVQTNLVLKGTITASAPSTKTLTFTPFGQ